ncbi:MAG TPA: protein kinase [Bryobacteraceae bacterium]|nr:protein kinase [Bryobacteraceae bacterium]
MVTMENAPQGKIGRYVIQGELGRGAMGVVYRAQDPAIGRTVAVKTIRIGQFDERELQHVQSRMMREAQAAGILSHNNIVTIYDIQQDGDKAYIFMEFVDGETLEKMLLADTAIDKQLILFILKQAAEALDYAHERGIVHRDIKPANIMVRRDGVAKIADFGIARMQSHSLTQTGQILGTPNYMSPEQISGKAVDGRADQYSLAVMLYEVLTGEKPFVADSLPTLFFRVVSEMPQPVPRLNPTLSPAIDDVLQKALSKNPDDRYPTCAEFVRSLERACHTAPGWTTLVRGGGLSQPTHDIAPLPQSSAPKPFVMPQQETIAPRPPAAPAPQSPAPAQPPRQTTPQPAPVVPAPAFEPRPPVSAAPPAKQAFNMGAIIAVGVVAALVGGGAIFWKLSQNKQKTPIPTAVSTPPVSTAPPTSQPTPTTTQKDSPLGTPAPAKPAATPASSPIVPANVPPPAAKPGAMMAVAIRTTPEGARIVIDEGKLPPCTSPCLVELPNGRHTASITLDTYKTEMRIFYVPQDTAINLNLEKRKGMLEVNSTPPGATITIDGAENPQKTPAIIPLVVGKHVVVVSLPGKPAYSQTFEMRPDATISLHPNWAN